MFPSAHVLHQRHGDPPKVANARAMKLMADEIQHHLRYNAQYYNSFVYHVPSSFLGVPTFNRDAVIAEITNELTRAGYQCEFLDKRHVELRISWESPDAAAVSMAPSYTPHAHGRREPENEVTEEDGSDEDSDEDEDDDSSTVFSFATSAAPPPTPAKKETTTTSRKTLTVEVPSIDDVLKKYAKPSRGRGRGRATTRGRGRGGTRGGRGRGR